MKATATEHREGVIKYDCQHTPGLAPPLHQVAAIIAWRKILFGLALIGQDPQRYQGFGFGNISARTEGDAFVISGTQTGGLDDLRPDHFVLVRSCNTQLNRIASEGPIRPSSESLTHGTLYLLQPDIRCVMHAHSPLIWRQGQTMGLPSTRKEVPYGTPAMADEVDRLWRESDLSSRGIFIMGGHEDGVISFGPEAETAGTLLVMHLAKAYQLENDHP